MMTEYKLSNNFLKVTISSAGAEVTSVKAANGGYEYLWQADPKVWKRHAPILFPIVGRLQDDSYLYEGKRYHMSQHGFARDFDWQLIAQDDESLTLGFQSNPETLVKYPFDFALEAHYELAGFQLRVSYQVANRSDRLMPFSIGGHPAFNADFNDAQTSVTANEQTFTRYVLAGNYLNPQPIGKFSFSSVHKIQRSDFINDAIILKADKPYTELFLQANMKKEDPSQRSARIAVAAENVDFFGIWSKSSQGANFVALEPWWGVADTTDSDQQIDHKLAIKKLPAGEKQLFHYSMSFL